MLLGIGTPDRPQRNGGRAAVLLPLEDGSMHVSGEFWSPTYPVSHRGISAPNGQLELGTCQMMIKVATI